MAVTQEQFDALVGKLESFAKRQPQSYRLRVALFAALGYLYIFLVLAGLLALFGLVVWVIMYSHRINGAIIKFAIVLLIPMWMIVRSLWVKFPPPQGLKLNRQDAPRLFALVDELTMKLQSPQFHNILLIQDFNAAVVQVPRLGIFGWQENYLLLGLPLMQSLPLEEFKAVLAHELGHLSGNHSRFSGWIYRIRKTWLQIYDRFHQQQHGSSVLFNRFLDWYWPHFNAYSFTLARMNEYEADRCAAQLAGAEHTAKALIDVEVKARYLEECFWADINQQVKHQADPPNAYSSLLTALREPAIKEDQSQQWLEQALAEKTNNTNTHPCLADRLNSLGYQISQSTQLTAPTQFTSAAEALLGDVLQPLIAQFDQVWKDTASTPWRQEYARLQEMKDKLDALEQKAQIRSLTQWEAWERAFYTLEWRGAEAALPLVQEVATTQPNNPAASYTLGQLLLNRGDRAGIAHIEQAIAQRIDWAGDGYNLIYGFLVKQGRTEEAEQFRQQAEQNYQLLVNAQTERNSVSDRDSFKPHTADAAEVEQLKQQLGTYSQVETAYLVEKVVTYFPERRFCVLGVVCNQSVLKTAEATQQLLDSLANNLEFPIQYYIVVVNHKNSGQLQRKLEQIEHSLIFRR